MWALPFRLSLLLFLTLLSPQAQSTRPQFFHQLQHHHHLPHHSTITITQSQKSFNGALAAAGQPTNPIATVKESSEHQDQMAAYSISISPTARANLGLNPNPISPPSAGMSPFRVNSENKGEDAAAKRLRRALIDAKSSEAMITPMPLQAGENLTDSVFKSMLPRGVPVPPSGPSHSHNSKITDSD